MRFLPPYIPEVPLRVWRAIGVMKTTRRLTAIIERDDEADVALCPELDIASQGDTVESARKNLIEALELFFESADSTEIARRLQGAGMVWILSKQPVRLARSVDRFRKVVERCPERGVAREFTGRLDRRPSPGRRFGRRALQRRAC